MISGPFWSDLRPSFLYSQKLANILRTLANERFHRCKINDSFEIPDKTDKTDVFEQNTERGNLTMLWPGLDQSVSTRCKNESYD